MPARNFDLHGNIRDRSPVALLLLDVINDFAYPGGDRLLKHTRGIVAPLLELKRQAHRARIPVIYANDNFGHWQSDFSKVLNHCRDSAGEDIARRLAPQPQDYFVLKPKHSAFFSTCLDTLLEYLGTETLILTGIAGDSCVLFTANDAYMRDFRLILPSDAIASQSSGENRRVLTLMQRVLRAQVCPANEVDLARLAQAPAALEQNRPGAGAA